MSRKRLFLLGVAILGVFSAVGLLATNFQILRGHFRKLRECHVARFEPQYHLEPEFHQHAI